GITVLDSAMRSRWAQGAWARSAPRAPTSVLPEPMKPTSASGRRRSLDAGRVRRHRRPGRRRGCHAAATLLRLDENLVAEVARLGEMVQDLGALRAGGVDLDAPVADDPAEQRLPGGAVLHTVDGDDLLLAADDARLDGDSLVRERVRHRLPPDPHDDDPQDRK